MHGREKAVFNKDKAVRLNTAWGVNAAQGRYSDDGHWYARLARFPAALFDAHGYVLFATEDDYRSAPMSIGKQISIPKPGISAMPGYVRMVDPIPEGTPIAGDNRFADASDIEGTKTETRYLKRKRSRSLRNLALEKANGVCSVCDRDFATLLGGRGVRVLQVHHKEQLSARDEPSLTKVDDLAVVCANCHILLHLDSGKPLAIEVLRKMLA